MIDLTTETTLSLNQAARLLPPGRRNRPVSFACVFRWVTQGAKGPTGELVKLEAIRVGGRWLTSRQALQRFGERLTPGEVTEQRPVPRSPAARERAIKRAEKELDRIGI
jgi:hypothetical protein